MTGLRLFCLFLQNCAVQHVVGFPRLHHIFPLCTNLAFSMHMGVKFRQQVKLNFLKNY